MALACVCALSKRRSDSRISADARSSCTGSIFLSCSSCSASASRSMRTEPGENSTGFASANAVSMPSMMS